MKHLLNRHHYRFKSHANTFYCPLCSTQRVQRVGAKMTVKHFIQVGLLTLFSAVCLSPWAGLKGMFLFFFYWAAFETSLRLLFKKDIPCPHCGFDATWYKRDVRVARQKVQEFWSAQQKQKTV